MTKRNYKDYAELAIELNNAKIDIDENITYVGYFEDVKCVLIELIKLGKAIVALELEPEFLDGYDDLYYLTIDQEGIWVEKAKWDSKGQYKLNDASISYVNNECNSAVLQQTGGYKIEVSFGEDECSNCDKCQDKYECDDSTVKKQLKGDVSLGVDENGDIHSVSIDRNTDNSKYHFTYKSSSIIDDDVLDKILSMF